ncbi:MAG: helix-turn-helix domain-containing protein [Woeseiaceae bacterium]|nr:helix-turn-helix domain-containing protein [Woeseiaceae bacterium]
MLIGELAKQSGVNAETIRYYEKIGLLPAPMRTAARYRIYTDAHLDRLRFIRGARALGFGIDAIRELVSLSSDRRQSCAAVDAIAKRQLGEVRQRLQQLRSLEAELKRIIEECQGGTMPECRILQAMPAAVDRE